MEMTKEEMLDELTVLLESACGKGCERKHSEDQLFLIKGVAEILKKERGNDIEISH